MKLDILYPAFNRLGYTKATLAWLWRNTDWTLVDNLVVYDDGSTDGTRDYLAHAQAVWKRDGGMQAAHGTDFLIIETPGYGGAPAVMNHYLRSVAPHTGADWFAKCDNDIAVPPGWLNQALAALDACPALDLLGIAAGWTGIIDGPSGCVSAEHIGGVGLMRRAAFTRHGGQIPADGRQGFTQWQTRHRDLRIGWATPDIAAVQLDLVPEEPWCSLKAEYLQVEGLQRPWPPYDDPSIYAWLTEAVPA